MIKFCHISPTKHLQEIAKYNQMHLTLAHLVESDQQYREFYHDINDPIIMDNSAFEMFKQNKPMYPASQLIDMGKSIGADYIVLSDYPNERSCKTIEAAEKLIPLFRQAKFKTFFVPQSQSKDIEDYIQCWKYALEHPEINLIGLSIIGAPNAFGVESGNKLQRFLSRWHILNILKERNLLDPIRDYKRIHMLGMVDGPNEISLVRDFHPFIYSWDSSAAVWCGLNSIEFDLSPTGLIHGKFETHVDFNTKLPLNDQVFFNINFIKHLLEQ